MVTNPNRNEKLTMEEAEVLVEARRRMVLRGHPEAATLSVEELGPPLEEWGEEIQCQEAAEDPEDPLE